MRSYYLLLLFSVFISCQTVKIEDKKYLVSQSTTEIGSIGLSKSMCIKNSFETRTFPKLENKIRVDVRIVPFNKKTNKIYLQKGKNNQSQGVITYIDSLDVKPELVAISILDMAGFVDEINAEQNKPTLNYLKTIKEAKVITSILTTLATDNIAKIRQADTYYITNAQDKKYTLVLYKSNKKVETIDLQSGVVVGYQLGKSCWALDSKDKWYLADVNKTNQSCKGDTHATIVEKKTSTNLYKM